MRGQPSLGQQSAAEPISSVPYKLTSPLKVVTARSVDGGQLWYRNKRKVPQAFVEENPTAKPGLYVFVISYSRSHKKGFWALRNM